MVRAFRPSAQSVGSASGQASIAVVGLVLVAALLAGVVIAISQAYLARQQLEGAADIAATRLAVDGDRNAALQLARANGAPDARIDSETGVVRARATQSILGVDVHLEAASQPSGGVRQFGNTVSSGVGGVYAGPLVAVDYAVACPAVVADYRRMQSAALFSGIQLTATSGFRTIAQQDALYRQLGSRIAAAPGASLHHQATEFDLAVGRSGSPAHLWLTTHASAYNFVQRYSWEPWHWGNTHGC